MKQPVDFYEINGNQFVGRAGKFFSDMNSVRIEIAQIPNTKRS